MGNLGCSTKALGAEKESQVARFPHGGAEEDKPLWEKQCLIRTFEAFVLLT